jgi:hypothetical protein
MANSFCHAKLLYSYKHVNLYLRCEDQKYKLQTPVSFYVVRVYVYNTCSTETLQINIVNMAVSYSSRTLPCFVHFSCRGNYNMFNVEML